VYWYWYCPAISDTICKKFC